MTQWNAVKDESHRGQAWPSETVSLWKTVKSLPHEYSMTYTPDNKIVLAEKGAAWRQRPIQKLSAHPCEGRNCTLSGYNISLLTYIQSLSGSVLKVLLVTIKTGIETEGDGQ